MFFTGALLWRIFSISWICAFLRCRVLYWTEFLTGTLCMFLLGWTVLGTVCVRVSAVFVHFVRLCVLFWTAFLLGTVCARASLVYLCFCASSCAVDFSAHPSSSCSVFYQAAQWVTLRRTNIISRSTYQSTWSSFFRLHILLGALFLKIPRDPIWRILWHRELVVESSCFRKQLQLDRTSPGRGQILADQLLENIWAWPEVRNWLS